MMRLLLTLLAALGFVWAALNGARAEDLRRLEIPFSALATAAMEAGPTQPVQEPTAELSDGSRASTPAEVAPMAPAANESPAQAEAKSVEPRKFGLANRDARIVLEAKEEVWVRVSEGDGAVVFMRTMKPGETYNVPNRSGLLLDTGNAKGVAVRVDGTVAPPLGPAGTVRRSVELDPETLPHRAVSRPRASPQPVQAKATLETPGSIVLTPSEPTLVVPQSAEAPATPISLVPGPAEITATAPAEVIPASATPPRAAATAAPVPAPVSPAVTNPAPKIVTKPTVTPAAAVSAPRAAPRDAPPMPLTGAAQVTPEGTIIAGNSRIALEVHKGTVVRLRHPAAAVFVADPEIADIQVKSAGIIYVFGRKAGETVLYATDEQERVILNTTVVVDHNVSRLRQAIRAVAPQAVIDVASIDGSVILSGAVATPVEAENIRRTAARFVPDQNAVINQLQVLAPNQINLRVRVAEVSRETLKSFGINWESISRTGNFLFGLGTGRDIVSATGTLPRNETFNSLFGSYRTGNQDINSAIDALSSEGLITVLAEPNLTALSGETAAFLAGGEFPIPLYNTNNTVTVEFKTFGVSLAFTPTVLDAGRVNLRVRPEVSQLSQAGSVVLNSITIPALTTRRAETTVELGSGQSFVIAGLLQNNTNHDISKVPFLGDVPILGALFKSDRFRRNETELVIIVTPYVVRPVSATRMALPTDGYVAPNDVERILGGLSYRPQLPERGEAPRGKDGRGLVGPSGFVLE